MTACIATLVQCTIGWHGISNLFHVNNRYMQQHDTLESKSRERSLGLLTCQNQVKLDPNAVQKSVANEGIRNIMALCRPAQGPQPGGIARGSAAERVQPHLAWGTGDAVWRGGGCCGRVQQQQCEPRDHHGVLVTRLVTARNLTEMMSLKL